MDTEQLLQKAFSLLARGKTGPARAICRKLQAESGEDFNVCHLQGVLALQEGQLELAQAALERALSLAAPGQRSDQALSNLALALHRQGRDQQALEAIEQAIALYPREQAYHANMGYIAESLGRWDRMEQAFALALELQPAEPEYLLGLAVALRRQAHYDKAWELLRELAADSPDLDIQREAVLLELATDQREAALARVRCILMESEQTGLATQFADYLADEGQLDSARLLYQLARELEPDNPTIEHMLASLERRAIPRAGAPDEYVRALYDQYADRFELHLKHRLQYGAPGLIVSCLLEQGVEQLERVLDLGCGTGLMGAALCEKLPVNHLAGVDLSANMIKLADSKGVYHRLEQASILPYLQANEARWTLICAADVLIYLGHLESWFALVRRRLQPGGLLAFTIEQGEAEGVSLLANGRYQHHPLYIEQLAQENGLVELHSAELMLRKERGEEVLGRLYLFRYVTA
ncbi:methyltransferase domain-containing protein [Aestuariirhabdus litorea]|uniref:Tetratricopeptide repeat protein n=1 Tax=Aestuariirhabdus litorea TaxID=2528527 RepID=A0A3P3VRE8_9GAMM|nr:methyltransferase domain-containing protein [Aestuariirhabdus litorea]RRJ84256.1 tetratricopeptide repeat protein [Aestuariirhabdus litorea]RWW97478.1 tetratricopeptide repeat protein [Endozoicomonadaceae bacterium GTF-13]